MVEAPRNYVFVLGRGRSGTTWIGRVLNAEPTCVYKFEPFNDYKDNPYLHWLDGLKTSPDELLREQFDSIVRSCQHDVDYPPFVRKPVRPQSPLLLRIAWQLGKFAPTLKGAYEWYGRPRFRSGGTALIKQVNFPNELLADLTRVLSPRIIGVVRNPFSSVASGLKYYKDRGQSPKSEEAVARVRELLALPDYHSMKHYSEQLAEMSDAGFETVRWRIQTEPLMNFLREYHFGQIAVYERIVESPLEEFRSIYEFLGWEFNDAVRAVIESTGSSKTWEMPHRREFSVYRDPRESLHKWRKNLSQDEKGDIAAVFCESSHRHVWPELADGSAAD